MSIITADRFLTIRCKAFAGHGVREHRIWVEADTQHGQEVHRGAVRVYDHAEREFTDKHCLCERAITRIRRTFQP